MSPRKPATLASVNDRITACTSCPRLLTHCRTVARDKRRAYREEVYWGRPVPSFGDPAARLLIVGLAPGAHGANRTGRMFTGDSSGDWLYPALHRAGFARMPTSRSRDDGQQLADAWMTAICHCAPPDNRPAPNEQASCRRFLVTEFELLGAIRVVLTLGRIAFDGVLRAQAARGWPPPRPRPTFGHGVELRPWGAAGPLLLGSFHPSRQNTNTGRLTREMLDGVLLRARTLIGLENSHLPEDGRGSL